jgi:EpsI family protein
MSARSRLLAVVIALLAPGLALGRWMTSVGDASASVRAPELSAEIGPWRLERETRLSAEHFAMLEPDAHLWRLYQAPGRSPIWAYVALYAGRSGYEAGAHDPEVCYPAQGWEIVGSHDIGIEPAGDRRFHAKLLDAHQGSFEQKVLYWFQPARRWPASPTLEQLARILDAMAGRPQYAFVRLAAPGGADTSAEADLSEFAARIAWPVRAALGADDEGGPAEAATPARAAEPPTR